MSASKKAAKKPVAKTAATKPKAKPLAAKKTATGAASKPVAKVKKATSAKPAPKPRPADANKKAVAPKAAAGKKVAVSKTAAPKATASKAAAGKSAAPKKVAALAKPPAKKSPPKAAPAKGKQPKPAAPKSKPAVAAKKDTSKKTAPAVKAVAKPAAGKSAKVPLPTAGKSAKAASPAKGKATVTQQPKSVGKEKNAPIHKPQQKAAAPENRTKGAPAAKPTLTRPTAQTEAAQTKPAAKKARPIFVKQSSSSKQDNSQPSPELDAKTKELVLSARKRTANGAAQKTGRVGKGAIAFTMDDVAQVLAKKQSESGSQAAAEKTAAAAKVAKRQEVELEVPQEKRVHSAVSLSDILGFNPTEKKSANIATSKGREVPRKWSRCFKLLIDLRGQVSNVLEQHTAETLKRSNRDDSGDLSGYGQHMADAGTDTFDRDFALSMVSSEQEALFEINEAIERIYNGSYGVCEITNEPISAERLEAVPFTRYSLEGQKELEKTKRQKIQRGGVFTDNEDNLAFEEDDN